MVRGCLRTAGSPTAVATAERKVRVRVTVGGGSSCSRCPAPRRQVRWLAQPSSRWCRYRPPLHPRRRAARRRR
eukprot:scaffold20404_cov18-Phaeocystis_antarctica.AAC.1